MTLPSTPWYHCWDGEWRGLPENVAREDQLNENRPVCDTWGSDTEGTDSSEPPGPNAFYEYVEMMDPDTGQMIICPIAPRAQLQI